MHQSLQPYLDRAAQGLLRMVEQGDLVLFNYTDRCTFERAWDEYTLAARGIIFERDTGRIVARPFDKFFNYEEHSRDGMRAVEEMIAQPHYIQEKMDGSLGIIYYHNFGWHVATRGSFTSDQALKAQGMLERYGFHHCYSNWTFLVEIIYPENKIIVPYGDQEKLVLLAVRDTASGLYLHHFSIKSYAESLQMEMVPSVEMTIEEALAKKKDLPYTEEGWVVVFQDDSRLKIKGDDYMRLAAFKANLSPLKVWEAMIDGSIQDMRVACPEELGADMDAIRHRFVDDAAVLWEAVNKASIGIDWGLDRKTVALQIQERPRWMHALLFNRIAPKAVPAQFLMRLLRPTNNTFADISVFTEHSQ